MKSMAAIGQMLLEGRSLSGHERHCCFINTRDGRFATASAASGCNFPDDGRGLGISDWDLDGDLDLWFANRTGPRLRFMRNNCLQRRFLSCFLTGRDCNRDAIGSRLELRLAPIKTNSIDSAAASATPLTLVRTLTAGHGFMSQGSKRIHFGIPDEYAPQELTVHWPDGSQQSFAGLDVNEHYQVVQGNPQASVWRRDQAASAVQPGALPAAVASRQSRTVIAARLPMPSIDYTSLQSDARADKSPSPLLVNLWSTTCVTCLQELNEFTQREDELRAAGLNVIALNVDELSQSETSDLTRSRELLASLNFPFAAAAISSETSGVLDIFHRSFLSLRLPLPVPSSFLVTSDGQLAVIYRGPVGVDALLADLKLLTLPPLERRAASGPFVGRWLAPPILGDPKDLSIALMRAGFTQAGAKYLETYLIAHLKGQAWGPRTEWPTRTRLAELCEPLADFYRLKGEPRGVMQAYQLALEFNPNSSAALRMLGKGLIRSGQAEQGLSMIRRAAELAPGQAEIAIDLGIGLAMTGQLTAAEAQFRDILAANPLLNEPHWHLSRLYLQQGNSSAAVKELQTYLQAEPTSAEAIRQLAWTLATANDATVRNGNEAARWAERLPVESQQTSEYWDLIAAIRAEQGDFSAAIIAAETAVERLGTSPPPSTLAALRQRLDAYRAGQPYREPR